MQKFVAILPLALVLAACDGGPAMVSESGDPSRVVTAQAAPSAPGEPAVQTARDACTAAIARPGNLTRVEHMRPASNGAMVILNVRRDPASTATERWRCGFDSATGRVVARNVS